MTLSDPCPNASFSLKPNQFANVSYTLRDPEFIIPWLVDNLVTNLPVWSCGSMTVTFHNNDAGQTSLNTAIFEEASNNLKVKSS